jgi:threonine/homoserine/homoserine lactone efflux protein
VAKAVAAVGSIYVLWLAWTFIRSARASSATSSETVAPEPRIGFWAGGVVLLFNPKAYYIIAVMFAQFLHPTDDGNVVAALAITTVFTLNNVVAFVAWAALGRALTALFRGERSRRRIDYVFAATLIAVALWMAASLFT